MKKKLLLLTLLIFTVIACSKHDQVEDIKPDKVVENKVITLRSGVQVEKRGKEYIYLGDIVLSEQQLKGLDLHANLFYYKEGEKIVGKFRPEYGILQSYFLPKNKREKTKGEHAFPTTSNALANRPGGHWSMLRYTLDSNLKAEEVSVIQAAISEMESSTNIRFYNATGQPTIDAVDNFRYNYVTFYSSDVNNSNIGSIGGEQKINIVSFETGVIIHEILHALGAFHEQSRADRAEYIDVHYENIKEGQGHNFDQVTENYLSLGPFDFNSIMLYHSYGFSKNGYPTLTRKDGTVFENHSVMSEWDRKFVNTYYIPYKVNPNGDRILLDDRMYKSDNTRMTETERLRFERELNGEKP